ncbi:hypothetical protein T484DRAFT_1966777 [Baffinella frigidus]|nr:hypothetical protein T484DRAFT_1966777 [Cryptophyta sp. CCMP2293]
MASDPFYSMKAEVEEALKSILDERDMKRVLFDVEMLEDSIQRVQGNLARYGLDEAELARRKAFVISVKQQISSLRAQGPAHGQGAAGGTAMRESLLGGDRSQRDSDRARANAALQEENETFIEGEGLKRALIQREQDECLDDLSQSVARIGEMGLNIHNELSEQDEILDDLDERTDNTVHNMADVNRLVTDMLKSKQGRNQLCMIVALTLGLVFVTTLIFIIP